LPVVECVPAIPPPRWTEPRHTSQDDTTYWRIPPVAFLANNCYIYITLHDVYSYNERIKNTHVK
jgi:hypothetical protein